MIAVGALGFHRDDIAPSPPDLPVRPLGAAEARSAVGALAHYTGCRLGDRPDLRR